LIWPEDIHRTIRNKTAALLLLPILLIQFSTSASAQTWTTETGHVVFTSSVPLHEFTGESDFLTGRISLQDSTVDFYVDLETLKTGINKRDKDMRISLGTDKNPFAEFYGALSGTYNLESEDPQAVTVTGSFKMNGVEQEVSVDGTLTTTGVNLILEASWVLRLEDYNIEPPKLLMIKVDQEQRISIIATLQPTSE
jgi:polyisoprenoid-binding protein YceI